MKYLFLIVVLLVSPVVHAHDAPECIPPDMQYLQEVNDIVGYLWTQPNVSIYSDYIDEICNILYDCEPVEQSQKMELIEKIAHYAWKTYRDKITYEEAKLLKQIFTLRTIIN